MHLTRDDLTRLIASLTCSELDAMRPGRTHDQLSVAGGRLDAHPVATSPQELTRLAGRINQCLHLDGLLSAAELIASPWIDRWAILAQAARSMPAHHGHLTFIDRTTGDPIPCTHSAVHLDRQAHSLARLISSRALISRVVSLAPPDSPASLIATCLLGQKLDADCTDDRLMPPSELVPTIRCGDLVIARGDQVAGLLYACEQFQPACLLVIDSPLDPETWLELKCRGIQDTIELYGTTEAGPIAWRDGSDQPFFLLESWLRLHAGAVIRDSDGERFDLAMSALWLDGRRFAPSGSTGNNPRGTAARCAMVAAVLRAHPSVLDVAVRPARDLSGNPNSRVQAYIIPRHEPRNVDDLLTVLDSHAAKHLPEADRPVVWSVGPAISSPGLDRRAG